MTSKTKRRRRARQITQIASVGFFLYLATLTYRGSESIIPLDLYLRLDPLAAFSAMLAGRLIISALLLAVLALASGIVSGRAWCGWLCPLGAVLDWVSPRAPYGIERHGNWRGIKYVLLFTIFIAALLGNLSFLILDPITILNRTISSALLPSLNAAIIQVEGFLLPVEPLQPMIDWAEQSWRGTLLPAQPTFYELGILLAIVSAIIVALNWATSRWWCRYLCPLGGIYALEAKIAPLRPRSLAECDHCAQCTRVCPTSAITVSKNGFSIDAAECVVCMDCVAQCPQSAIEIGFHGTNAAAPSFDLSRRHFLASLAFGIVSVTLFRSAPAARHEDPFLVRPPGAQESEFMAKCIRCSECVKVCPTGGLQPALFHARLEGLWTPVLVSRLGYCDYSCNACGQICPTGAIPPLALEQKRQQVIGLAYIDQHRCIPWASYRPCIVCQEMCPVPDKAVKLEEVDVVAPDGTRVHLQRPHVQHELCIGCGICEYQCPLKGPAAIQVYVPTRLPALS